MRNIYRTFNIYLALCLVFSVLVVLPVQPVRASEADVNQPSTSPESFINSDGTLNLNNSFSGSLDLEGWDVQMDSVRGPVFHQADAPLAALNGKWESLAGGVNASPNGDIKVVAVNGSDVYVGGTFKDFNNISAADHIVKWDGSNWLALGSGSAGDGSLSNVVNAIAFNGTNIYVGGGFTNVNNGGTSLTAADRIAKFDGTNWSALGSNGSGDGSLGAAVNALAVSGSNVYAAGNFTDVNNGGVVLGSADRIAKFDGTNWSALGSNGSSDGSLNAGVTALAIIGSTVYAGGNFTNVNNNGTTLNEADYVAKFDGTDWSALGNNGSGDGSLGAYVQALAVSGSDVYVGGGFGNVNNGGTVLGAADYIAKFDGTNWSALGSNGAGNGSLSSAVNIITINGSDIYVGGNFSNVNNGGSVLGAADYIAKFNGTNWSALGSNGSGNGSINSSVVAIAVSGSNVFAGGLFTNVNNNGASLGITYLTKFDGTNWQAAIPLQGALRNTVKAVAVSGTDVYIGGDFTNANNIPEADYIAKWNGSSWSALGSNGAGNGSLPLFGYVYAIAINGADVYVGGNFTNVNNGGTSLGTADYIAKWNGTDWSALGNDGTGNGPLQNAVTAIAVSGSNVYAGGYFIDVTNANTILSAADYIAMFDGTNWSAMSSNGSGNGSLAPSSNVAAIAVMGSNVYVGGTFFNVNDNGSVLNEADHIAKWDGTNWFAVGNNGAGNGSLSTGYVNVLAVSGSNLYVGGSFYNVSNGVTVLTAADYIAKWDGTNWSALGSNGAGNGSLNAQVSALAVSATDVYVGGYFNNVNNGGVVLNEADHIAKFDGTNWSAMGSNGAGDGSILEPSSTSRGVNSIAVGPSAVYAGGYFFNLNNNGVVLPYGDYTARYVEDGVAPTVSSITRATSSPSANASVDFTVTFSESVTGVGTGDFTLTTSGIFGASVSGVSGSGATRTVTVNTGTSGGTIRLDVVDDDTIKDEALNPLGGAGAANGNFTSGQVYTIIEGGDTVGVFRPTNGALYMKNANTTGFADYVLTYGLPGDYPVVGDWDGNGTATLGVYRSGNFYLRNSNTNGFADMVIAFGAAGDQPVAGDWDGDGIDTIGLYRSSIGMFFLRNTNSTGAPDISFSLGVAGDVGIAGDWNGDGVDTTGVFRPSNGALYLKNANTTGFADIVCTYGLPGDMPVTGDWDNDGIDTIGIYRNGGFYLRNSNTNGFADINLALGINGDMPIAGNWDGLP